MRPWIGDPQTAYLPSADESPVRAHAEAEHALTEPPKITFNNLNISKNNIKYSLIIVHNIKC